ncbi:MAG: hypothetical protein LBI45_05870 [Bacteroidales bacterium]|jgi:hypothetical protein|nr:hypothetical protein [Bacteroidales bacterium]
MRRAKFAAIFLFFPHTCSRKYLGLDRDRIEKSKQSLPLLAKPRSLRSRRFANRTAKKWLPPLFGFGLTLAQKKSQVLVRIYLTSIDKS